MFTSMKKTKNNGHGDKVATCKLCYKIQLQMYQKGMYAGFADFKNILKAKYTNMVTENMRTLKFILNLIFQTFGLLL